MVTKTKTKRMPRLIWVWGDKTRGIAIERKERKGGGRYWWDILHVKDGRVVIVHRDYPSKAEAIREAKAYGRYETAHPRKGFLTLKRS